MNVRAKKKPRLTSILIMFTDEDETGVNYPHDDALTITLEICSAGVKIVLIDTESSTDTILKETLDYLKIENLKIKPVDTALYGFAALYILPLGFVQLPLTIGDKSYQKTTDIISSCGFKDVIRHHPREALPKKKKSCGKHAISKAQVQSQ